MKGRYGSPLSSYGKTTAWRKVCRKRAYSRTISSMTVIMRAHDERGIPARP
jgi:hypothetical protein